MSASTTTPQTCPENITNYSNHFFLGKKTVEQQTLLGWDYRQFVFDVNSEQLFVVITDNSQGISTTMGASDLTTLGDKIVNDFYYNSFVPLTGNATQLSYTVAGDFLYITVTGAVDNNLQITIRNDNTGVWADGSPDPESDGIEGRVPSNFTIDTPITNAKCEVVEVLEDNFNEFTDKVFFAREGSTQLTIDGLVFGYSLPETTQWSSALSFDSTHNYRLTLNIDTDGLGSSFYSLPTATFATFYDLISWFNDQAVTYGSSLRVVGDNNRIFMMQADAITPIVGDTDPYLSTASYIQFSIEIEDLTAASYLVKGLNPKPFNVSNVQVSAAQTGMYKGNLTSVGTLIIPELQFEIAAQGEPFNSASGYIGDASKTKYQLRVYNFPLSNNSFQTLNPTIELLRYKRRHKGIQKVDDGLGGIIRYRRNSKNIFVHPTHNNGAAYVGQGINGGQQFSATLNLMPDRTTEWAYTSTVQYERTIIDFDIAEWKGKNELLATSNAFPFPVLLADYETVTNTNFLSTGAGSRQAFHGNSRKSDVFALRLRCDNPDGVGYIYGPISDKFKFQPKLGTISGVKTIFGWKLTRANFNKNR